MSLLDRLPKKPTFTQRVAKMNVRERLTKIGAWLLGLLVVVACCGLTILVGNGLWSSLSVTVQQWVLGGLAFLAGATIFSVVIIVLVTILAVATLYWFYTRVL